MDSVNASELAPAAPLLEVAEAPAQVATKPRVWTTFATWLVALVVGQMASLAAFVTVGVVIGFNMGAQGADPATIQTSVQEFIARPLPALLLSLIPFQLGMTLVVLFAARRSPEPFRERLGLVAPSGRTFGALKLLSLSAFTVSTAFGSIILSSLLVGPLPEGNPIAAVITDGSWFGLTILSVLLSVIPALAEETLFRGYIQRRFLKRWSPAVAILASSVLFALMHMDSLQHIIAVVPLAVVTGLLAYRTDSVKPGMLVHGVHNAAAVAIGAGLTALSPSLGDEGVGMLLLGLIAALGLLGLPAVISLVRKPRPTTTQGAFATQDVAYPAYLTDSGFAGNVM